MSNEFISERKNMVKLGDGQRYVAVGNEREYVRDCDFCDLFGMDVCGRSRGFTCDVDVYFKRALPAKHIFLAGPIEGNPSFVSDFQKIAYARYLGFKVHDIISVE